MAQWLWAELKDLFEKDDGSLPEVRVNYADKNAVASGYSLLRGCASEYVNERAYFWSKSKNEELQLESVPNAAALVVAGDASPFHVVLAGVQSQGATIPDLGVFVFQNQLALDYRMGSCWTPTVLEAFFRLLLELCDLDEKSSLSLEDGVVGNVTARFQQAWHRYVTENAGR